jgi:hypothetical protein
VWNNVSNVRCETSRTFRKKKEGISERINRLKIVRKSIRKAGGVEA